MATSSMSSIVRPLCVSTILSKYPLRKCTLSSTRIPCLLLSHSLVPSFNSHTPIRAFTHSTTPVFRSYVAQDQEKVHTLEAIESESEEEVEDEEEEEFEEKNDSVGSSGGEVVEEAPKLSVKEKKELASYAHSLGKKLKSQLVGKSGVTPSVASSFIENLESNELLKIKIHGTCPGELEDVVKQLERATGSVVVSQIGRTIIVYRPSIAKMKAEEKKREARRVYVRKGSKPRSLLMTKVQGLQQSGRGRRGSSRV